MSIQSSSSMQCYHFPPPRDPILSQHHSLLMALVYIDALGEQDMCGRLDDNDHHPAPSHVQLVKCEFSSWNVMLGMPNF